jgi:hypothetical protein
VQSLGEVWAARRCQKSAMLAERQERIAEVEAEIDGLLARLLMLRRCRSATSACSKHPTASRWAERAAALSPA